MNLTFKIGRKLKKLRKKRFLQDKRKFDFCKSQESFAEQIGCNRATVLNWENDNTFPDLEVFIKICDKLDCDPNFLLSDSSTKSLDIEFISKKLGLSIEAVEKIVFDDFLSKLLNYFLESNELIQLTDYIRDFTLTEFISEEILRTSFNSNFRNEIEKIFSKFYIETFPLSRDGDSFQLYLKNKISFEAIKASNSNLISYIKNCVSEDTYNQIYFAYEESKVKSDEALYELFIQDTVMRTYDILSNRYIKDIKLAQITQTICNLLSNFHYDTVINK